MSRTPFAIFGCPRRYRDRRRDNVRGILQEHPFGGV